MQPTMEPTMQSAIEPKKVNIVIQAAMTLLCPKCHESFPAGVLVESEQQSVTTALQCLYCGYGMCLEIAVKAIPRVE